MLSELRGARALRHQAEYATNSNGPLWPLSPEVPQTVSSLFGG